MLIRNLLNRITNRNNDDPYRMVNLMKKRGVRIGHNVHIYNSYIDYYDYYNLLSIGDDVTITNATILLHDASTNKFMNYTKIGGVSIGNKVFVGYGCIILPGATIGDNVICGAGTVVRGVVPDDSVILGNPWRVVCKTSEYISKNQEDLNELMVYDMCNQLDIERMNPQMKKGYIN